MALVAFLCLVGFSGGGSAIEPTRLATEKRLVSFVMDATPQSTPKRIKVWESKRPVHAGLFFKEYKVYEHVSPESTRDFVIEYVWHIARVWFYKDNEGNKVLHVFEIITETREDMTSPGYTVLVFRINDWGINGSVTGSRTLWLCDRDGTILIIDWPPGYLNKAWDSPTQEVVEAKFNTELKLWKLIMEGKYNGWN
jgi:hypothetical protein